jgi:hypothetical protein
MVDVMTEYKRITVTVEQYNKFKDQWLFDAIGGLRYGEAFCKYFGLTKSNPLYFFKDTKLSERWIKDNYLVG